MEKNDTKKMLMIALPIILIIFLCVFFIDGEKTIYTQDYDELLIPNSEKERLAGNKVEAYKQDKLNRLARQREKEESQVKGQDFFFYMADDDRWETGGTEKKIDSVDAAKLYDEIVLKSRSGSSRKNYELIMNDKNLQKNKMSDKVDEAIAAAEKINLETEDNQKNIYTEGGKRKRRSSTSDNSGGGRLIAACIHGNQVITNGGVVRMRLLEDFVLDNVKFPANTLFYGIAQISQDRMSIRVENLKLQGKIVAVACEIYDNDAIQGLNLPDNIKNELTKRAKTGAIDGVQTPTGGGDMFSSAISSVVNVGKNVLRKEESQIKVDLKANYKIFIKQI